MSEPLLALAKWESVVNEVMDATRRFPKHLRSTLGRRLDDACLDALLMLSEARFLSGEVKQEALKGVDGELAKTRVLLRVARARDAIGFKRYQNLSERVDEVGRMIGGLRRGRAGSEFDPEPPRYTPHRSDS